MKALICLLLSWQHRAKFVLVSRSIYTPWRRVLYFAAILDNTSPSQEAHIDAKPNSRLRLRPKLNLSLVGPAFGACRSADRPASHLDRESMFSGRALLLPLVSLAHCILLLSCRDTLWTVKKDAEALCPAYQSSLAAVDSRALPVRSGQANVYHHPHLLSKCR